jgi:hypothetical protein
MKTYLNNTSQKHLVIASRRYGLPYEFNACLKAVKQ